MSAPRRRRTRFGTGRRRHFAGIRVAAGSKELRGNFTLTVAGKTTAGIPYDATANDMKTYLDDLASVGSVSVTRGVRVTQAVPGLTVNLYRGDKAVTVPAGDVRGYVGPPVRPFIA